MNQLQRSLSLVAGLALATGCVMPDQMNQIQKDLADVRSELNRMSSDQEQIRREVTTALEDANSPDEEAVTRKDLADLSYRIDALSRDVQAQQEALRQVDRRVSQDIAELESAARINRRDRTIRSSEPIPTVGNDATAGDPTAARVGGQPDAEQLYNEAYSDFSKGNYDIAIAGFQEYVETFADKPLADNAQYWVGECYFSKGDFRAAIQSYDTLLERYPDSDKAAAANLKKALSYQDLNQIDRAIIQLRYVVETFPSTNEAKVARERLAGLGINA